MVRPVKIRVCLICKKSQNDTLFGFRSDKPHLLRSECNQCLSSKEKLRIEGLSPEATQKIKDNKKKYRLKNKDKIKNDMKIWKDLTGRDQYYKKTYNISLEDYNNLLESQNYTCKICKKEEKHTNKALAVDHCHSTGKVRGLLCFDCNTALGKFKDSTELLYEAINYLQGGI